MIQIENLTKRFGDRVAVADVTLHVEEAETLAVVGPNGAGKTTIFKVLSTLAKPDGGRATVAGLDVVESVPEVRRQIGYMPDAFGAYDLFNAFEYLDYFAAAYGLKGRTRLGAIQGVMDLCDLGPVRAEAVGYLSRGIRQRLLLAKTLLHDPKVLILDEPASGLDPRARVEIREVLLELKRMGKTIVISSHILSELAQICTRVALLERGKLVAVGAISELHRQIAGDRVIRLTTRKAPEEAESILTALSEVRKVLREGDEILVIPADGVEDPEAILRALLASGVGVRSYREEEPNLEKIFLSLTKGEIQ